MATSEFTQEFGWEQAGQRVGWVSLEPGNIQANQTIIAGTVAKVGEEGAQISWQVDENGRHRHTEAAGFEAMAHVALLHGVSQPHDVDRMMSYAIGGPFKTANHVQRAIETAEDTYMSGEPLQCGSTEGFLNSLKEALITTGLQQYYPELYLRLNHAYAELFPGDELLQVSTRDWALPDPGMNLQTTVEQAYSERVTTLLEDVVTLDEHAKEQLTYRSTVDPEEVPFAVSRLRRSVVDMLEAIDTIKKDMSYPESVEAADDLSVMGDLTAEIMYVQDGRPIDRLYAALGEEVVAVRRHLQRAYRGNLVLSQLVAVERL